jgi:hypothetical protein
MKIIAHHQILVAGDSYQNCKRQVEDFFQRTQLVRYDRVEIDDKGAIPGSNKKFGIWIKEAVRKNRQILQELVQELENTGVKSTPDLLDMPQGYPSKVLHILTHFLDGFIGTDSAFYNLIDDSHWLMESTEQSIKSAPGGYWLIPIDCYSASPEKASLIHQ